MFVPVKRTGNYEGDAESFLEAASSYLEEERDVYHEFAELANISALIYSFLPDLNWAGFYLFDGQKLVVGPFQGEPACAEIRLGRGVCGTAAERRETLIVPDVSKFPSHIACSGKSRSEIVVPILKKDGTLYGVIDLDSPLLNRFSEYEKDLLESLAELISR